VIPSQFFLSNASGSVQPHHSVTSQNHLPAGLPRGQSSSTTPSITVFTSRSSFILPMCQITSASSASPSLLLRSVLLSFFNNPVANLPIKHTFSVLRYHHILKPIRLQCHSVKKSPRKRLIIKRKYMTESHQPATAQLYN